METYLQRNFDKACDYVRDSHSKLDSDLLVRLYGYFKQATVGECRTPKPSVLNFQALIKWKAWSKLGNISKSEAMNLYVTTLNEAVENWEENVSEKPNKLKETGWISVSCLCKEVDVPETEKGIYDWVKEGDLNKLKQLGNFVPNLRDEHDLTLLHWAADRGHLDVAEYLITQMNVDVNDLDADGQSPLHYAAACGHLDICKLLVDSGANVLAKDRDQLTPKDVAEEPAIKLLLSRISL